MGLHVDDLQKVFPSPELNASSATTDYEPTTPTTQSGATSSNEREEDAILTPSNKKKKKKKSKKSAKAKEAATATTQTAGQQDSDERPPVLCISRNKHWRYISSYHGSWLQLPLELLDSLLTVNLNPVPLTTVPEHLRITAPTPPISVSESKQRDRGHQNSNHYPAPDSSHGTYPSLSSRSFITPKPGKSIPPPVDPGVFRSVNSVRRLIDEAAELSVRASSGLSAAEIGSSKNASGLSSNPWANAAALGITPLGSGNTGGRSGAMSAMRTHRLRALAVQKLAQAYKCDEIASSVMVMQGGSVFEDLAERVLKYDPTDLDAQYVHFFHEKIPSRQLAESTNTKVLDVLIAARPQHLEYYRTRGIVHCFRDEYPQATKDFTYALKEARAIRKAKTLHHKLSLPEDSRFSKNGKRKKANSVFHSNGQAPADGTCPLSGDSPESVDGECQQQPSTLSSTPDPIEPQLLFLRGAAHLHHAIHLIETAILEVEGVEKGQPLDGAELKLSYLEEGRYGGVEVGNPDGPLGKSDGVKVAAYRAVLAASALREQVTALLRKSIRDHEKFLSHFESIESPNAFHGRDIAHQMEYAFLLAESSRSSPHPHTHQHHHAHGANGHSGQPSFPVSKVPAIFTTYHPLIVESQFSILICQLMLADFIDILPTFARTAAAIDGLDGYPVFLPPRSMTQAEFMELLERLAGGWAHGTKPHSLVGGVYDKQRLMIDAPPSPRGLITFSQSTSSSIISEDGPSSRNGESSSSVSSPPPSTASSISGSLSSWSPSPDGFQVLDCARILLAPVAKRQRLKAEKAAAASEKGNRSAKKKPSTVNIPLHGPRVDLILAWLGAVHLPELDLFP